MSKTGTMDHRNRIISEHLIYEIHMLNYSYKNLQTSLPDQAAFNVLMECFCLHVRNLIDFFWEDKPQGAKDAVARHFADEAYKPFDGISPQEKTGGLYGKLNKQISHITYDRTADEAEKINPQDREFLYEMIEEEITNFRAHIRSPYTQYRDLYSRQGEYKLRPATATVTSEPYTVVMGVFTVPTKPQDG